MCISAPNTGQLNPLFDTFAEDILIVNRIVARKFTDWLAANAQLSPNAPPSLVLSSIEKNGVGVNSVLPGNVNRRLSCKIELKLILPSARSGRMHRMDDDNEKFHCVTKNISDDFFHNRVDRCIDDKSCMAYKYQIPRPGNCALIQENSTVAEGQVFKQNGNSAIYRKGLYRKGLSV